MKPDDYIDGVEAFNNKGKFTEVRKGLKSIGFNMSPLHGNHSNLKSYIDDNQSVVILLDYQFDFMIVYKDSDNTNLGRQWSLDALLEFIQNGQSDEMIVSDQLIAARKKYVDTGVKLENLRREYNRTRESLEKEQQTAANFAESHGFRMI